MRYSRASTRTRARVLVLEYMHFEEVHRYLRLLCAQQLVVRVPNPTFRDLAFFSVLFLSGFLLCFFGSGFTYRYGLLPGAVSQWLCPPTSSLQRVAGRTSFVFAVVDPKVVGNTDENWELIFRFVSVFVSGRSCFQ